jgi:carboxypeptidase family protein/TonB-dependent receptor-like protein
MTLRRFGVAAIVWAWLAWLPATVHAQSAIAGVIKDTSGSVMPGVNVEAASPALIERMRAVVSDEHGEYKIVDLRPGTYSIIFTLTGFSTFKRDGIELPGNFTATVNAELRVGSLEETITVAAPSPVVDVQSTAKAQVISRDLLDSIPTGRSAQSIAQLVPSVTLSAPDVGGSRALTQTFLSVHAMGAQQTVVMLDGMQMNGFCNDGGVQSYANTQNYEEMVFQTSGAGADVSGGGARQNMIPKRGGNELHGSFAAMGSTGGWVSDNLTQDLINRGLTVPNKLSSAYDYEGGIGGKIVRDKLWFFGAARFISQNNYVADTFSPDGSQGIDDQWIRSGQLRLTWQASPRNQITAYNDRVFKYLGHSMVAGDDPATAAQRWPPSPLYMQTQVKWTSTLSNKLLIEAGVTNYMDYRQTRYEPGVQQLYGSPEWLAGANRTDTSRTTSRVASAAGSLIVEPVRRYGVVNVSYVTGSHSVKIGVQDSRGRQRFGNDFNADLRQIYQNGVPVSVIIQNTPVRYQDNVDADLGLYGQDSWTMKHLTLNYGLRWEYFKSSIPAERTTPGRFMPDRAYNGDTMPVWKTLSPRFGLVYDLFGDAKTALKLGVNKYEQSGTYGVANVYNPIALQSATVTWKDLNGDDIAQGTPGCIYQTPGCEINLAQLPQNFGLVAPGCSVVATPGSVPCGTSQVDPSLTRIYTLQYNVGVQHELLPRVSVTANWFHVAFRNLKLRQNLLQTFADYTPVQIASPLDGSVITIYNISAAKVSQVQYLDTNAPSRHKWDNSLEFGFNARLPRGATLFGGTATERLIVQACDEPSNPNNLLYCDQTRSGIPWITQLKLAGTLPLPLGIQLSGSLQSYRYTLGTAPLAGGYTNSAIGAGTPPSGPAGAGTVWLITPTTRYPAGCTGPCTPGAFVNPGMTVAQMAIPLIAPGVELSDRINQLDVTVGKSVTVGKMRVQPEASLFNALNRSAVYAVRSLNYLTSSYNQPSSILSARILRLGLQLKW